MVARSTAPGQAQAQSLRGTLWDADPKGFRHAVWQSGGVVFRNGHGDVGFTSVEDIFQCDRHIDGEVVTRLRRTRVTRIAACRTGTGPECLEQIGKIDVIETGVVGAVTTLPLRRWRERFAGRAGAERVVLCALLGVL